MNSTGSTANPARLKNELALPWDLGDWVNPAHLLDWVVEEVNRLDWTNPKLLDYLQKNPAYRPKMLLCLLTWAYAAGVFESEEVTQACFQHSFLQSLCSNKPPSSTAVARFRRENRGLLRWSLVQVFKRVLKDRFKLADSFWPAGLNLYLADTAVQRLDLARQMDRGSSGF
jgi:transposase